MNDEALKATAVVFGYRNEEIILKNVGLTLRKGEILGILGPNGSGKTTFMRCLNRLLTPSQGEILLDDRAISEYTRKELATRVGFVPQSSESELSSPMVYDVVMMGRRPHMTWQFSEKDDEMVWEIMKELDVAHLASHHFNELSSGQSQRVLIARAIAQDVDVLLLDEPTSNLDVKYQIEVMRLIRSLVDEKGVSACAIIHDLDLAMRYCDKVVLLHDGVIVSAGTPVEAMTPDTIKQVYGVTAYVEDVHGRYRVMIERRTMRPHETRTISLNMKP
jgi:iron complex transport system ATP-binding protein